MEKVIVFILTDDIDSVNISRLSYLFSENLFEIKIVNIHLPDLPEDDEYGKYGKKGWIDEDYYRISWVLKKCSQKYLNNHILIIRDSVITHSSPQIIEEKVRNLLLRDFDICYLSKYQDRCDLYTNFERLDDNSMIAKTFYPGGLQAIMISPKCREILLANSQMKNGELFWDSPISINITPIPKEELDVTSDSSSSSDSSSKNIYTSPHIIKHKIKVYKRYWGKYKELECKLEDHLRTQIFYGNINAICLVPNLFAFDLTYARSNGDYDKLCECQRIPYGEIRTETNYISWAVLVIFIIILMIGLYLLLMK